MPCVRDISEEALVWQGFTPHRSGAFIWTVPFGLVTIYVFEPTSA